MTEPPLVVIAGPTGTGKSALSLELGAELADRGISAEIVNADAMQLYRGMDIGTAKLSEAERRGIPHHLLDMLDVSELSTVADYQAMAKETVRSIRAKGSVPLLVGGSGLYISALIHDFRFPGTDSEIRNRLEGELERDGSSALWQRLSRLDPSAAAAIDVANGRRVIRALEVIAMTGADYSASLPDTSTHWVPTEVLLLDVGAGEREQLKARLADRARGMFENGLLDEVEALLPLGLADGPTASRAIGYAQAIDVLAGQLPVEEAIEQTIGLTWRYVRRQRSWFARYSAKRLPAGAPSPVGEALDILLPRLGA